MTLKADYSVAISLTHSATSTKTGMDYKYINIVIQIHYDCSSYRVFT